ncbi:MAG: D-alanyl-D-alanine carboxypeptidase family protein [Reyranellaceae bacterium]
MTDPNSIEAELARQAGGPISFGHLAYREARISELVMLPNGQFLHPDAARAFLELSIRAASEGLHLVPKSGFRSRRFQRDLFLFVAKRDGLTFVENVRRVALPGYSEHHTGFAIDIDRGPFEDRRLKFEETRAYAWLSRHAASFGFRNSFPRDNVFGVEFEPWHWRWEGSPAARTQFQAHAALEAQCRRDPRAVVAIQAIGNVPGLAPDGPVAELQRILADHQRVIGPERPGR